MQEKESVNFFYYLKPNTTKKDSGKFVFQGFKTETLDHSQIKTRKHSYRKFIIKELIDTYKLILYQAFETK